MARLCVCVLEYIFVQGYSMHHGVELEFSYIRLIALLLICHLVPCPDGLPADWTPPLSLSAAAASQHVKVETRVSGFVGQQALLRCQFVDPAETLTVTQVTWVKDPSGAKINLAVHNPELGIHYPTEMGGRIHFRNPSLQDATLVIDSLQLDDDGVYSCEFATYPSGNQEAATNLTVLATPENTATALLVQAGESEIPVATCISERGKPAASIAWRGGVSGNISTQVKADPAGTITVTSHYLAVPSGKIDGLQMQCIVTQAALLQPEVIKVTLSVQYPPMVTIEGYDDNWYLDRKHASLTCNVKANPKANTFSWRMNGGEIPPNVRINGHQLTVDTVTFKMNSTFTCEATNSLGKSSGSVDIVVRESQKAGTGNAGAIAGGVVGGILALLLVVCLAGYLLRRRKMEVSGTYDPKRRVFGATVPSMASRPDFAYRPDSDSEKGPSLVPTSANSPSENTSLAGQPEAEGEEGWGMDTRLRSPAPDDDMESLRDGSIISKKPVFV
ncbi:nectin-1 [Narcine bancroftii]|uniref:nectin-1 n=1 Tax=Narcine bancroftii TaxID=1343680 RepID=UPI0038318C52